MNIYRYKYKMIKLTEKKKSRRMTGFHHEKQSIHLPMSESNDCRTVIYVKSIVFNGFSY